MGNRVDNWPCSNMERVIAMNLKEKKFGEASKIRKGIPYFGVLICFFFACLNFQAVFFASNPQIPGPGDAQKTTFDTILRRVNNNSDCFPYEIKDVVDSFNNDGVFYAIKCPENTRVSEVHITIRTKLILWDRNLSVKGKSANVPNFVVGYYYWNVPPPQITNSIKFYNALNYIMLEPNVTSKSEETLLGKLANEGLVYHELLHGQLQMNAIKNNKEWRENVCNCIFDLSAMDPHHNKIYGLVEKYLESRTEDENVDVEVVRPNTVADKDGKFEVPIIKIKNKTLGSPTQFLFPGNCNVNGTSVEIIQKNNDLYATGKLLNQDKPGFFLVQIDPPSTFVFAGIERGVVILPDPPQTSDFPESLTESWYEKEQIVLLLVILLILGIAVVYRRIHND